MLRARWPSQGLRGICSGSYAGPCSGPCAGHSLDVRSLREICAGSARDLRVTHAGPMQGRAGPGGTGAGSVRLTLGRHYCLAGQ